MSDSPTAQYVQRLQSLKAGDLGRLRTHAGFPLDESVDGFDLFAGLWWPLRQKNQRAPRREVAWLIAKLFAACPIPQTPGAELASQLGGLRWAGQRARRRHQDLFDSMLELPLDRIEPALRQALSLVADHRNELDWVRLIDDLSIWHRESTRLQWAEKFLGAHSR